MLDKLDEALEKFLTTELKTKEKGIEVSFKRPSGSSPGASGGRPTVNFFLHDLRENNRLRGRQPTWEIQTNGNHATLERQPLRLDVHYMVTVWTDDPHEEHRILLGVLNTFFRYGELPTAYLTSALGNQPQGVPFKVAQYETHVNPRDLWSVLGNEMRPAIDLVVTIAVDPYLTYTEELVHHVDTKIEQKPSAPEPLGDPDLVPHRFLAIGGLVITDQEYTKLAIRILENGLQAETWPAQKRFRFQGLRRKRADQQYTLEVTIDDNLPVRFPNPIIVPGINSSDIGQVNPPPMTLHYDIDLRTVGKSAHKKP